VLTLFNPRKDRWSEHFWWKGPRLVGLTANGRVTVHVLGINHPERLRLRRELIAEGVFPPKD
jgi:hypothetical protein